MSLSSAGESLSQRDIEMLNRKARKEASNSTEIDLTQMLNALNEPAYVAKPSNTHEEPLRSGQRDYSTGVSAMRHSSIRETINAQSQSIHALNFVR